LPMILIRVDGPQAHDDPIEGSPQQGEIRLGEFVSSPEQARDDKEISIEWKKAPELRHRDRIPHSGDRKRRGPQNRRSALPA